MRLEYEIDRQIGIAVHEWTPKPYLETFHWHSAMEIGCCLSGKGTFHFGDKVYEAGPGDIFIVNNLERHIAKSDEHDPSRYLFVFFDPVLLLREDKELMLPFVYNPSEFDNRIPGDEPAAAEAAVLIRKLLREQNEGKAGYRAIMHGLLMQLCGLLYRHCGQRITKADIHSAYLMYEKMQPVLRYMKEHFREDLQLKDIAQRMRLSPSRARHVFSQSIGEGFKEYLLQLRINEAKRLLAGTQMSVIDICLQSGFQSTTPFYRAFRQIVGLTPQAYREQTAVMTLSPEMPGEPGSVT